MTTTIDPTPAPTATTPLWKPLVACGITLVLWASAFVGIRHLGDTVPPGSLSLGRLVVMVAALGVYLALKGGFRLPTRKEWPLIALGGAAWLGVYNLALNESERRIDAATAALIVQVGPIVVALLAGLVLKETLHRWVLIGTGVGFAGVVIIGRASANGDTGDWIGVALSVVAALTFAIGVLTQKKLLPTMGALLLTFWYGAIGLIVCLPWSGELVSTIPDISVANLGWLVYLGLFPSALAFVTWAYALSHSDAGKFAQTTFLVPFITALMAWLLLDEVPPALAFVGGAMCIAGVLITRRQPR
ncbi:drug/metabolite transporter (DMT)-like permease [Nocardioides albertanoniae]|uniref:Drug/metabolite transporter (DMT)-like permease n=1 Tax=Nocardioides albertanoniae TaxID=1175486 RepID=A0A543A352_9ACTN|nr:DMT family transporter [Nocardioides albertanoniae]TQL67012.1 drug/metabolite transporter (DMT)-like permease [Nocardioides albertanoniae]